MIDITNTPYVNKKYEQFIKKYNYYPMIFNPYNLTEIVNYSPTISTQCGSLTSSASVLITEIENDNR